MSSYDKDIRAYKRTKLENKADWLVWRKGKFSPSEIKAVQAGLDSWVGQACAEGSRSREQVLEALKWAKENKVTAWCEIATRAGLPDRKIGAIRHCILRRMLPGSEISGWTAQQTAEFKALQEAYGKNAWKQISQDTGRTLEDVANKGKQIADVERMGKRSANRFSNRDVFRVKLAKLVREGLEAAPYELNAIDLDCKLVSLVRLHMCPEGGFAEMASIFDLPSSKFSEKLNTTVMEIRLRWYHSLIPSVIRRVHIKLSDEDLMDALLIYRLRKSCRGELLDVHGRPTFPCHDWTSINWKILMPMWPQGVSENRVRQIMRSQPRFDLLPFPDVVEAAAKAIFAVHSKSKIALAAELHLVEMRHILTILANRGDALFAEDASL
jgi:hypothetical protein